MKLKVITLNCWGIPVISKDRIARMKAIAEELSSNQYDIVCLQEVWADSDYELIKEKVKTVLAHSYYFHSGVIGSGICIFSKFPFQDVFFHQWPVNGYVHKLQHGDWFGGKGVGLCRLKINDFNVNVYSAHLHAEYDRNCDEYMAHRVLQAFDTAQFIKLTSGGADVVILAGDLNTEPGDLAYRILTATTDLGDAFVEAGDKVGQFFSTNEGYTNSYTDAQLIDKRFIGKRIDYIMYRSFSGVHVDIHSYEHPLPSRVRDCTYSYSDHEAVCSTFDVSRNEHVPLSIKANTAYKTVLLESINIFDEAMNRLNYHKRLYWFLTAFLCAMLFVTVGMDAPFNFVKIYHVLRVLLTGVLCFTLVMATLWNNIEYNAVLAGKRNMEVNLKQLLTVEDAKRD